MILFSEVWLKNLQAPLRGRQAAVTEQTEQIDLQEANVFIYLKK